MKFYLILVSCYLVSLTKNIFGNSKNSIFNSDEVLFTNDMYKNNFHKYFLANDIQLLILEAYDKIKQSLPDEKQTAPKLIENAGFSFEEHIVVTTDGYILTLHRIPCGRNKCGNEIRIPVLCVHGVLGTSTNFILSEPDHSLGFLLADAGYDVWLANTRGTLYSMKHTVYSPKSLNYWNFSFHEKGIYDLPAMIDYILTITGQEKLAYVGHSAGTTILYVLLSVLPEYNDKISIGFMMSPIVYLKDSRIPYLNLFSDFSDMIKVSHYLIGEGELLAPLFKLRKIHTMIDHILILNYALFFKIDLNTLDLKAFTIFLRNSRGISIKELIHFNQLYKTGEFKWYDYKLENIVKYNSSIPPFYDLCSVTAPTILFYSINDNVISYNDTKKLDQNLHRSKILTNSNINHCDYIMGQTAKEAIYDKILTILNTDITSEIPVKEVFKCYEIY